ARLFSSHLSFLPFLLTHATAPSERYTLSLHDALPISSIKFSDIYNSHNSSFSGLNAAINNSLKGVSTFNAGAEYRINQLSLRGGFHYEESPYQNTDIVGDLIGFSVGTGYNFGFFTCDLAYSRSEQSRNQPLYAVGLTDTAKIDSIYNN